MRWPENTPADLFFDSCARANYYPVTAMRAQLHIRMPIPPGRAIVRSGLWILLLVLAVSAALAASIPRPHHQPRQIVHTIETLEQQLQQAELDGNTTVMASMLSDDYLGIYGDGTLATKAETLAGFKSGATHFTKLNTSDRKIRVYGSTVVVVSRAEVAGVNHGDNINGHYRYTRVYHRSNGVWKVVSFEASTIHEHGHNHS